MERQEINDYVGGWLQAKLSLDNESIAETKSFFELGLDSFGFIELITAIERQFQVSFSVEDLMATNINSLRTLSGMVATKIAGLGARRVG